MKTHAELIDALAAAAPSVHLETLWSYDEDGAQEFRSLSRRKDDCFYGEDPEDWCCWQAEVKATVIVRGSCLTGSDQLGGTWEKSGDHPAKSNPDISGYYPQMAREALGLLREEVERHPWTCLHELAEIDAACNLLQSELHDRWSAQQEKATA